MVGDGPGIRKNVALGIRRGRKEREMKKLRILTSKLGLSVPESDEALFADLDAIMGRACFVLDKIFEQQANSAGCHCGTNWRQILSEVDPLIDKIFVDSKGERYLFFGVVHGKDDLYYGMRSISTGKTQLLSCVGSIEGWGFVLADNQPAED